MLRHAEATPREEGDLAVADKERSLTEQGRLDAAQVARRVSCHPAFALNVLAHASSSALAKLKTKWQPSVILASDATRSRETLEVLQEHLPSLAARRTIYLPAFYDSSSSEQQSLAAIFSALNSEATESDSTVMLIGHNDGWQAAATALSGKAVQLGKAEAVLLKHSTARSWTEAVDAAATSWRLREKLGPSKSFKLRYSEADEAARKAAVKSAKAELKKAAEEKERAAAAAPPKKADKAVVAEPSFDTGLRIADAALFAAVASVTPLRKARKGDGEATPEVDAGLRVADAALFAAAASVTPLRKARNKGDGEAMKALRVALAEVAAAGKKKEKEKERSKKEAKV